MSSRPPPASPRGRLRPGECLGRYEIVSWLGEGGMGEVYCARDPRLNRRVALKILHRRDASDDELVRFGNEARAAGSLNHPNIVAVHDVGTEGDVPYVVTELLEGETLRARLDRGPLPYRTALDYAAQIAAALDAAHVKGIWHRDVKPANAFITRDDRVKLLDFGVAKLSERTRQIDPDDSTAEGNEPSGVIGTTGYMSPEQVQGQKIDHRTDIFALGSVLYEMFTGHRAFQRATLVESLTAVLRADPVDPLTLNPELPPLAAAIVRRCLEKNKERRFQSARDLAFDLRQLSEASGPTGPIPAPPPRPNRWLARALLAGVAVAAPWVLWIALQPAGPAATYDPPFTSGAVPISGARFASNGNAVVYSTARDEVESGVVLLDLQNDAARRPLTELPAGASVLAARAGELALWINRRFILGERYVGALRRSSFSGVAVGADQENIEGADWNPAGERMAIIRSEGSIGGPSRLEYPEGRILHETEDSLSFPRISPDGRHVAFLKDHSGRAAGGGIWVVDADEPGAARPLSADYVSMRGLAWSADGKEIWFSAGQGRSERSLRAVDLQGNERAVLNVPGTMTLWDIAPDGRVLLSRDTERRFTVVKPPDKTTERNLSASLDAAAADISPDGSSILYAADFRVYVGPIDESSRPTYLDVADAFADALSPDGRFALATSSDSRQLMLVPTGPGGEIQTLEAGPVVGYNGAYWFSDSQRVLFNGQEKGQELRAYVQDITGGPPRVIMDRRVLSLCASPTGDQVAAGSDDGILIWPMEGMESGAARTVPGSLPEDRPVAWSEDERFLWVFQRDQIPAPVDRIDVETGERTRWKDLGPPDPTGVYSITEFKITPDGSAYFYTYRRVLSELYLARSLR